MTAPLRCEVLHADLKSLSYSIQSNSALPIIAPCRINKNDIRIRLLFLSLCTVRISCVQKLSGPGGRVSRIN